MYQLSITAIVTCHNLHDYLPACVESIKAQTMRVSEVIVMHDSCPNPPVYPDTTTVLRQPHRGVAAMRNEGAALATSEHLLFVDADDVLNEYFIEGMIKVKADTKADIIYPNVLLWSSWHDSVKLKNAWHESTEKVTRENMLEYNQIVVSSLVPKSLYLKAGGTPNIPILEDYQLWMECLKQGATFAKSPQSVLKYRQRTEGRLRSNDEAKNEWYFRLRDKYSKI